MGNPADKTDRLSLKCPWVRRSVDNDIVENPNDRLCLVRLVLLYIRIAFPRGYRGPFFLHEACRKERKKKEADGDFSLGSLHANGVWGEKYFNTLIRGVAKKSTLRKRTGKRFTQADIDAVYDAANPERDPWALNFTTDKTGKYLKFLDGNYFAAMEEGKDYGIDDLKKFTETLRPVAEVAGLKIESFSQKGNYHDSSGYRESMLQSQGVAI